MKGFTQNKLIGGKKMSKDDCIKITKEETEKFKEIENKMEAAGRTAEQFTDIMMKLHEEIEKDRRKWWHEIEEKYELTGSLSFDMFEQLICPEEPEEDELPNLPGMKKLLFEAIKKSEDEEGELI